MLASFGCFGWGVEPNRVVDRRSSLLHEGDVLIICFLSRAEVRNERLLNLNDAHRRLVNVDEVILLLSLKQS